MPKRGCLWPTEARRRSVPCDQVKLMIKCEAEHNGIETNLWPVLCSSGSSLLEVEVACERAATSHAKVTRRPIGLALIFIALRCQ